MLWLYCSLQLKLVFFLLNQFLLRKAFSSRYPLGIMTDCVSPGAAGQTGPVVIHIKVYGKLMFLSINRSGGKFLTTLLLNNVSSPSKSLTVCWHPDCLARDGLLRALWLLRKVWASVQKVPAVVWGPQNWQLTDDMGQNQSDRSSSTERVSQWIGFIIFVVFEARCQLDYKSSSNGKSIL